MGKNEILKILGPDANIVENENCSALCITINSESIDVQITIPYSVHELFYEAADKQRKPLVSDWHDFYGDKEVEDFKESLMDIADIIKSPIVRLTNNGKTIVAKGIMWYYFFGNFVIQA